MRLFGKKNIFLKTQGKEKFSKSFGHAIDGIDYTINHERNIKIEIFFAIITSILGFLLKISLIEWLIIILSMGIVLSAELINTAIERTVDLVTKDYQELAKAAKDTAAGAVLISSIFVAIIGLIIFLPKILLIVKI